MTPRAEIALGPRALYPAKAAFARARAVAWLARGGGRRRPGGIRILFYHRVSDDRDELAVSPRRFARQIEWLAAAGLVGRDVGSVAAALAGGEPTAGVVGLSFDDGYRDVAEFALPVLEAHGFTATVFLATAVTDGRARFAWYERQPPLLSWDEVRRLDGGALRFESHTVTHRNLVALTEAEAREEIEEGKRELERRLGRESSVFCYPAGLFGARERALVAAAGFAAAVSCEPGANTRGTDPLALRRIQVDRRDSLLEFRAKVGGGFDAPPPLRAAWRRLRYGMPPASSRS